MKENYEDLRELMRKFEFKLFEFKQGLEQWKENKKFILEQDCEVQTFKLEVLELLQSQQSTLLKLKQLKEKFEFSKDFFTVEYEYKINQLKEKLKSDKFSNVIKQQIEKLTKYKQDFECENSYLQHQLKQLQQEVKINLQQQQFNLKDQQEGILKRIQILQKIEKVQIQHNRIDRVKCINNQQQNLKQRLEVVNYLDQKLEKNIKENFPNHSLLNQLQDQPQQQTIQLPLTQQQKVTRFTIPTAGKSIISTPLKNGYTINNAYLQ